MRKVCDDTLLQMLKEGHSQKACAEYFQVSEAYISKRVKRLCPHPSLEGLTDRERRFVVEVAGGASATQAALKTCDVSSRESAKVVGSNLMSKPEIQSAIGDLMEKYIGRVYRVKKLKQFIESPDHSIGVRSLDMAFKLGNDYPANKNVNLNVHTFIDAPVNGSDYE